MAPTHIPALLCFVAALILCAIALAYAEEAPRATKWRLAPL